MRPASADTGIVYLCQRLAQGPSSVNALLKRSKKPAIERDEIPPGTLDLLILKTLAVRGTLHGYEIAEGIERTSDEVLQVEEGSLYPALQRMLIKGWVSAAWGVTAGNRRARYYTLTAEGRKRLNVEISQFERVIGAITRVIQTT